MATTANYGWTTPEQSTAPPDVAGWFQSLAAEADGTVGTRILYGPVANAPGTLEPGQIYCGY